MANLPARHIEYEVEGHPWASEEGCAPRAAALEHALGDDGPPAVRSVTHEEAARERADATPYRSEPAQQEIVCQNPACGHPESTHGDGDGGCTAPSYYRFRHYCGGVGLEPLPCICSHFRPAASPVAEGEAVTPLEDDDLSLEVLKVLIRLQRAKLSALMEENERLKSSVIAECDQWMERAVKAEKRLAGRAEDAR